MGAKSVDSWSLLCHNREVSLLSMEDYMSLDSRIQELQRKHDELDKEIEEAFTHPSVGDLELAEMKRRKLQMKDEIEQLKASGGN